MFRIISQTAKVCSVNEREISEMKRNNRSETKKNTKNCLSKKMMKSFHTCIITNVLMYRRI
jgi:hypothetical protein